MTAVCCPSQSGDDDDVIASVRPCVHIDMSVSPCSRVQVLGFVFRYPLLVIP